MSTIKLDELFEARHGELTADFLLPPPSFVIMQAEIAAFDPDNGILTVRFPVLEQFCNPYGSMQGGMIAAAVDNTLGPLSMLVARPNVTRRLEMKYSKPITPDLGTIIVTGKLLEEHKRQLTFSAEVRSLEGLLLARAKAWHWIV